MTIAGKYVIALEEHYWDAELAGTFTGAGGRAPDDRKRLRDLGELRIEEMDEAGIDLQVHLARRAVRRSASMPRRRYRSRARANDRLHEAVATHPDVSPASPAAHARPEGRGGRARARGQAARLQGRDGARPDQRRVLRRQALLADLRARAGAGRADLSAPRGPAQGGRSTSTTGTTWSSFPAHDRGLGLHDRDGDAGRAHGA